MCAGTIPGIALSRLTRLGQGDNLPVTTAYEEHPGLLRVCASGQWDLDNVQLAIDSLPKRLRVMGATKALIDITDVTDFPRANRRHKMGIESAQRWPNWMQVALIVKAEWISKAFATAARTQGVNVQSFGSPQHAFSWLAVPEPEEPMLTIEECRFADHMLLRMVGAFSPDRVRHTIESVPVAAEAAGVEAVIVDSLDMEMPPMLERHALGRLVAKVTPPWLKIGVVIPPDSIDKMFENAARAGGARMRVVGSIEEARERLGIAGPGHA